MGAIEIILGIFVLLFSIIIIGVVLFQQGRSANISGAIAGGADTFFDKNKARTIDNLLAKATKYIAIIFFVFTLVANAFFIFGNK